ncbi:MAG: hypothetical protein ACP5GF_07760 [Thiomonas sp.]
MAIVFVQWVPWKDIEDRVDRHPQAVSGWRSEARQDNIYALPTEQPGRQVQPKARAKRDLQVQARSS